MFNFIQLYLNVINLNKKNYVTEKNQIKTLHHPVAVLIFSYYRFKFSDEELASYNPSIKRKVGCNLRGFLLEQRIAGPLEGIQVDILVKFSESYEHARHEPAVSFV